MAVLAAAGRAVRRRIAREILRSSLASPELGNAQVGCISMEDSDSGVLIQRGIRRQGKKYSVIEMGGTGPIDDQDNIITEVFVRAFWRYYAYAMGYTPTGGWKDWSIAAE